MARSTVFVCAQCGHESAKWHGRCPGCEEWNSMAEERVAARAAVRWLRCGRAPLREAAEASAPLRCRGAGPAAASDGHRRARPGARRRDRARLAGADRRRAGDRQVHDHRRGAGEPGGGGPSRAVRVGRGVRGAGEAARRAARPRRALRVPIVAETDLDAVEATLEAERPDVCVVDSVQTLYASGMTGSGRARSGRCARWRGG